MLCAPGNQEYEAAPLAVKVADCPAQSVEDVVEILTGGDAVTLMVNVCGTLLQPPNMPLMVYTVVAGGINTLMEPEPEGLQV